MGWVLHRRTGQITVLMVGFIAVKENQAQSEKGEDTWGEVRGWAQALKGLRRCPVLISRWKHLRNF